MRWPLGPLGGIILRIALWADAIQILNQTLWPSYKVTFRNRKLSEGDVAQKVTVAAKV